MEIPCRKCPEGVAFVDLRTLPKPDGIPLHKEGPECTVASSECILLNNGQILRTEN